MLTCRLVGDEGDSGEEFDYESKFIVKDLSGDRGAENVYLFYDAKGKLMRTYKTSEVETIDIHREEKRLAKLRDPATRRGWWNGGG